METSTAIVEALPFLIPIIAILSGPVIVFLWFRHSARKQAEVQKTLRAMIESGQQISPEVLEKLAITEVPAKPVDRREKDFRWGVLLIAIGVAFALFGFFNEGFGPRARIEKVMEMVAIGSFLLLIGLARLGLWKYAPRDDRPERQ